MDREPMIRNNDLVFRFEVDGQRVPARITADALADVFGAENAEDGELTAAYQANWETIHDKALEVFRANPGAEVLLTRERF